MVLSNKGLTGFFNRLRNTKKYEYSKTDQYIRKKFVEKLMESIKNFFRESREELKRVNWPRREETVRYTVFVIVFSVGLSLFLGALDYIFIQILQNTVL